MRFLSRLVVLDSDKEVSLIITQDHFVYDDHYTVLVLLLGYGDFLSTFYQCGSICLGDGGSMDGGVSNGSTHCICTRELLANCTVNLYQVTIVRALELTRFR